jgi:hypothetical protein
MNTFRRAIRVQVSTGVDTVAVLATKKDDLDPNDEEVDQRDSGRLDPR